ncbi:RluA family pseudouridine synthase [Basilea psittacipulmonis]|uniref:Pseudouridine synthase n=1 Tax=Basilea psittacipulmonis DSM 24701 TaxID=1072685 RepID=A0A077DJM4_9BURK|nr:RluA family pseudouridine synthase [Basilea psittacipulmonis]AIL33258.1 pseudouridine synthase [Basilea psittacipulmonis DSM 24701]
MDKDSKKNKSQNSVQLLTIDESSNGQRLDNFLIKICKGVPKSHLYKAIRSGQVRVNRGRAKQETRLSPGDVVRIPPLRMADKSETYTNWVPQAHFPIVYEDEVLLVINKPAGVAVHGGSGVSFGVIEQIRASRPDAKFLELVHRLDKETSGLLMIAKKRSALVTLQDYMRHSQGNKEYLALVKGDWVNERQHIKLPLYKYLTPSGERRVKVDKEQGKYAHTIVSLQERYNGLCSLVKCQIKTGRTHQIRVHLASQQHPIINDDKYGDELTNQQFEQLGFKRMFLHACQLDIPHPVTQTPLHLTAPLPDECQQILIKIKTYIK